MGWMDGTVDSEQPDYKSTARAVLIKVDELNKESKGIYMRFFVLLCFGLSPLLSSFIIRMSLSPVQSCLRKNYRMGAPQWKNAFNTFCTEKLIYHDFLHCSEIHLVEFWTPVGNNKLT